VELRFEKMHGLGNDFVVVDGTSDLFAEREDSNWRTSLVDKLTESACAICNRRFGIGADGLILVLPSATADFKMHYVNSDGSISPMCGNGVRCVGKFVFDHGLWDKESLALETGSGILHLDLTIHKSKVSAVKVSMGTPSFDAASLPAIFPDGSKNLIEKSLSAGGEKLIATCLSVGNPHCVTFLDEGLSVDDYPVYRVGKAIENATDVFPERVNVEFAKMRGNDSIDLRVWERGCGETLACGSGACATVAAAVATGRVAPGAEVAVRLPGGILNISWSGNAGDSILMSGPAVSVYSGFFDPDAFSASRS
jgi:diaminopimelate epimerase